MSRARFLGSFLGKLAPGWYALFLGLIGVLPLTIITPPLQVPDEMEHFYRSYQISQFALGGLVRDGTAGAVLPSSLVEMTEHFLRTRNIHMAVRPIYQYPIMSTLEYLAVPLEPDRTEFTVFSSTVVFSPLAYMPQALAIGLLRPFGVGPLALLYAARIASAITAIALVALAVQKLPFGRSALFLSAALPMTLYEFASVSADSLIISSAFLYTAIALKVSIEEECRFGELLMAIAAGLIFCSTKITYFPILFLAVPALFRRDRSRGVVLFNLIVPIIVLAGSVLWVKYASGFFVIADHGGEPANVARQMQFILANPQIIVTVAVNSIVAFGQASVDGMIGLLGWADISLPEPSYVAAILGFVLCVMGEPAAPRKISGLAAAWNVLLIVATISSVGAALYLTWTAVGSTGIETVQGRYFTPILPILLLSSMSCVRLSVPDEVIGFSRVAIGTIAAVNIGLMYWTLIDRFGVF